MRVVFRADASRSIGSGHVMRCLSLAEILRSDYGVQIGFVCREEAGNLISFLQSKSISVSTLPPPITNEKFLGDRGGICLSRYQDDDAAQTIFTFNSEKPDLVVVDHYGLDAEWEKKMRPHTEKIMVIDDLANRFHDCDFLLDQNYSVGSSKNYKSLVPESCQILQGPQYALLNKEFSVLRQAMTPTPHKLKRVLIFFTAGNDQGETLKAMEGVVLFGGIDHVDVVVGNSNPDNMAIQALCFAEGWVYHCQIDYMPELIAQADLVIGAGGSSNWERCALGVPALVTILAANQVAISKALDVAGVIINMGWNWQLTAEDYANTLRVLTVEFMASMSQKAFRLVDAQGAERLANILTNNKFNQI